ncbi:hypothetical protein ABT392_05425 [Paucibacter sp. JuS9]|uniref:hypothetical protein n=1 Tax=Paucibacter sp. JuS9 TaxID=3228748 RepID=UPI0037576A03
MLRDLSDHQRELAEYMSSLSQRAYAAGWMEGIEFELWRAVLHGPFKCGLLQLEAKHVERLAVLSKLCEGWIYFHEEHEESFASVPEWEVLLARQQAFGRQNAS